MSDNLQHRDFWRKLDQTFIINLKRILFYNNVIFVLIYLFIAQRFNICRRLYHTTQGIWVIHTWNKLWLFIFENKKEILLKLCDKRQKKFLFWLLHHRMHEKQPYLRCLIICTVWYNLTRYLIYAILVLERLSPPTHHRQARYLAIKAIFVYQMSSFHCVEKVRSNQFVYNKCK